MFKAYAKRTARSYVLSNRISDLIDRWPDRYIEVQRMRLRGVATAHRLVGPSHKLVVEGFPRSGNSFVHKVLRLQNPKFDGHTATHVHRSTQVVLASRWKVPAVVLVREPRQAVNSLLALAMQQDHLESLSPDQARSCIAETLRRYVRFHRRIQPLDWPVIALFEEFTADVSSIPEQLNQVFELDLVVEPLDEGGTEALFATSRSHLSPNSDRDRMKALLGEAYDDPSLRRLRGAADSAYSAMECLSKAQKWGR